MSEPLSLSAAAWLSNSLKARAAELRAMQHRCAKAYKLGHMAVACERLSLAYASAAYCFERELEKLTAERAEKGESE